MCFATIADRATAQTAGAATASVEGDVYLLTRSGDVKPVASNTVLLVPASALPALRDRCGPSANLQRRAAELTRIADSAYDAWIARRKADPTIGLDTVGMRLRIDADKAQQAVRDARLSSAEAVRALASLAVRSAPTGMRAHYTFEGVEPGQFVLFTEHSLMDRAYHWLVPVTLRSGERLQRDLDNTLVQDGPVSCASWR